MRKINLAKSSSEAHELANRFSLHDKGLLFLKHLLKTYCDQ